MPKSKSTNSMSTRAILISCPDCGSNLEVTSIAPVELESVDEEDDEDDDEDDDDDLDEDDDDEDDDDETTEDLD